jgi:hypothetical protein
MKYKRGTEADTWHSIETRARNGNLEVPVYFLKGKQGHTVRKYKKIYKRMQYKLARSGMKFRNKKKFRYAISVHFEYA